MNIQKRQIFEFVKKLNVALINKKKHIVADKFKGHDSLLIYLFEMRLIKNYKILSNLQFSIELVYDINGNSVIRRVLHAPQKHYKRNISLENLRRLVIKTTQSYLFFETRKGILSLSDCLEHEIGGNLLFWMD